MIFRGCEISVVQRSPPTIDSMGIKMLSIKEEVYYNRGRKAKGTKFKSITAENLLQTM